jgi:hypothetical protein
MKINYFIVLMISTVLMSGGCKEEKHPPAEMDQMKEVMAIHDEVMPKMATIGDLVSQLMEKTESPAGNSDYEAAMKDLQNAHQAMMEWMQGFGERFDSDEILKGKPLTDQKKQWLDEEEEKIRALEEQINGSIARARDVLN